VCTLNLPDGGPSYRLTTQTGMACAMSGSGGPKVRPLMLSGPVGAIASQTGFVVASQPVRHSWSAVRCGKTKLGEVPVQPMSKSVPDAQVRNATSSGPPFEFRGQASLDIPHRPPPRGSHFRITLSTSRPRLPVALAMIFRILGLILRPTSFG